MTDNWNVLSDDLSPNVKWCRVETSLLAILIRESMLGSTMLGRPQIFGAGYDDWYSNEGINVASDSIALNVKRT